MFSLSPIIRCSNKAGFKWDGNRGGRADGDQVGLRNYQGNKPEAGRAPLLLPSLCSSAVHLQLSTTPRRTLSSSSSSSFSAPRCLRSARCDSAADCRADSLRKTRWIYNEASCRAALLFLAAPHPLLQICFM